MRLGLTVALLPILARSSATRPLSSTLMSSRSHVQSLKVRSRTISIRLSEEEYSALRDVCVATGARSISALTREAVLRIMDRADRKKGNGNDMNHVRARMLMLEKRMEQLTAEVAAFRPGS